MVKGDLQPWQQRLIDERNELTERIDKLEKYIEEAVYEPAISNAEYRLMQIQFYAMCAYKGALSQRMSKLGLIGE